MCIVDFDIEQKDACKICTIMLLQIERHDVSTNTHSAVYTLTWVSVLKQCRALDLEVCGAQWQHSNNNK